MLGIHSKHGFVAERSVAQRSQVLTADFRGVLCIVFGEAYYLGITLASLMHRYCNLIDRSGGVGSGDDGYQSKRRQKSAVSWRESARAQHYRGQWVYW